VELVYSVNGVPIRLTDERWAHITNNKPYITAYFESVLDAIERPTWILRGYAGALVAVMSLGRRRYLHVVYRELSREDGFIVTAFLAQKVNRRAIIWPKKS
jgi:hypothetical protein